MSTVVFDGKTIASDSQVTAGQSICSNPVKKLVRSSFRGVKCVIGGVGDWNQVREMFRWISDGADEDEWFIRGEALAFSVLLVYRERGRVRCLEFENSPLPGLIKRPHAIGSGADFAMGALEAGVCAVRAVKIASRYDIYTGGKTIHYSAANGDF